jgi:hypothetical protein
VIFFSKGGSNNGTEINDIVYQVRTMARILIVDQRDIMPLEQHPVDMRALEEAELDDDGVVVLRGQEEKLLHRGM